MIRSMGRGGIALALAVAGLVSSAQASSASTTPQWSVQELQISGTALNGRPIDFIGVGDSYLGLVLRDAQLWVVTSNNGRSWQVVQPAGLAGLDANSFTAYPGGLNNVAHVLFSDGEVVYLRAQSGYSYNALGSTLLFASDASGAQWRQVSVPAPGGRGAFPIAALKVAGRSYLAGAVYEPSSGQSYLDGAIWSSTEGASWSMVDSASFGGAGNQAIFALTAADGGLVAGGGDGSLIPVEGCCYFPDGIALWRGSADGVWDHAAVSQPEYGPRDSSAVVGFLGHGRALEAVVSGNRRATSGDGGRAWKVPVTPPPKGTRAVYPPRADFMLKYDGRLIGITTPAGDCTDCTEGAIAISSTGGSWKNVTPTFPCGQRQSRPSYGFVSKPMAFDTSVAALGGCGQDLQPFDETLLAVTDDGGRQWRIERLKRKTGTPLPAVAGHGKIVTLAYDQSDGASGQVRAITVRR
ncbi:MAG: hypothetical protein ABWX92_02160 [Mycetocola sp.]